jgi:orotidine-5'-phosphate decarboxylase
MLRTSRLIIALDETSPDKALDIAKKVSDQVDAIKINWPLVLSGGPEMISKLAKLAPVICDFKIADIPNTNRLIAEEAFGRGASGIIVQGFVGHDSAKAVVDAAKGKEVFIVTEMSHPGGKEFTAPIADQLAKLAVDVGASGVIAPATRPERIAHLRSIVGDLLILSPGVGAQGGRAAEAVRHGADFVIVGRSIYGDPDPRSAARAVIADIESAFQG